MPTRRTFETGVVWSTLYLDGQASIGAASASVAET
jgi:hypothetical protein